MKEYLTLGGFTVFETDYGLDVYEGEKYLCELYGKSFADYTYNGEIDDDRLENAIDAEVSLNMFMLDNAPF